MMMSALYMCELYLLAGTEEPKRMLVLLFLLEKVLSI